jgi:hypothetical protein
MPALAARAKQPSASAMMSAAAAITGRMPMRCAIRPAKVEPASVARVPMLMTVPASAASKPAAGKASASRKLAP